MKDRTNLEKLKEHWINDSDAGYEEQLKITCEAILKDLEYLGSGNLMEEVNSVIKKGLK
jgi:hypothetical protein